MNWKMTPSTFLAFYVARYLHSFTFSRHSAHSTHRFYYRSKASLNSVGFSTTYTKFVHSNLNSKTLWTCLCVSVAQSLTNLCFSLMTFCDRFSRAAAFHCHHRCSSRRGMTIVVCISVCTNTVWARVVTCWMLVLTFRPIGLFVWLVAVINQFNSKWSRSTLILDIVPLQRPTVTTQPRSSETDAPLLHWWLWILLSFLCRLFAD